MGGKKDKKKKNKDPLKKAALAAKKDAKADRAALKRLQKDQERVSGSSDARREGSDRGADDDRGGGGGKKNKNKKSSSSTSEQCDDLDSVLESYRNRTRELAAAELETLDDDASPFPNPPRGNFTWTLCPSNGMFYMFGGEYYDGAENLVFDELLRWDPDAKRQTQQSDKDDDDDKNHQDACDNDNNKTTVVGQWTRILTPSPRPPPRCAHSTVHHNDALYIFGGECATADRYHHYKDMWKFDTKLNTWEECRPRGGSPPAARSGHRAVTWRHYMILFGGFHEALRSETRWFNDLHIYDFQTATWTELKYNKLARLPPPRSACNMSLCTSPSEALFVYGGYSKVRNANAPGASKSEGITHVDCWTLPLKSLIDNANKGGGGLLNGASPPAWERITRKGEYPSGRAGTSCVLHKNKMLVFGGVLDNEGDHHKMESVFYDDLFALDMERRRWFAMRLKKKKKGGGGGRRRRKKDGDVEEEDGVGTDKEGKDDGESDEEEEESAAVKNEEAVSSGWDLDHLRQDMFAFIDGDGNVVYERIEEEGEVGPEEAGDASESEAKSRVEEGGEATSATRSKDASETMDLTSIDGRFTADDINRDQTTKTETHCDQSVQRLSGPSSSKPTEKIAASLVMKVDDGGLPAAVTRPTPLPRINCAAVVRNSMLYVYGGVLEVGDREVTLDDCWSIDLNKRDKWTCIWAGQMHRQVWKGVDSDNDSYISSDQGGEDGDGDSDDDDVAEFEPIMEGDSTNEEDEEARKKAKKAAKKAKEKEKRRGLRHEIAELKEKLHGVGADADGRGTPLAGESVADFYARTTEHWNAEAESTAGRVAADRGEAMSAKELKREGFRLARERYERLKPVLDRLDELESAQLERGEDRKAKKKSEKKPKKDRLR